jgi:chorismate synthase
MEGGRGKRPSYAPAVGNTTGVLFRATTFGESHGPGLGVVVDGCPPKLPLDAAQIQHELDRRRPGQSRLVSQRDEPDRVEILSGVLDGQTLGTPIALLVRNADARGKDYDAIARAYRPSHADYTYDAKFGIRAVAS